jgi:hypothetical protein
LVTLRLRNTNLAGPTAEVTAGQFALMGKHGIRYFDVSKGSYFTNQLTVLSLAPNTVVVKTLVFEIHVNDTALTLVWQSGTQVRAFALE